MHLYQIPELFRRWEEQVDEAGGEITPALETELAQITTTLSVKADALAALVRESERAAEAFRAEARAFAAKAQHREALAERLKGYLLHHLKLLGLDRHEGLRFRLAIVRNAVPSIQWPEGQDIPEAFRAVTVSLDGRACQQAYRQGALPDGFLVTHGEHLRIR